MIFIKDFIKLLTFITRLTRKYNSKLIYNLLFNYYIFIKVKALLKMQLKMTCVSNEIFLFLIMKHGKCSEFYADENLYILCNYKAIDKSCKWFYLCSKKSKKQYKVAVIFNEDIEENNIYVSESMKFNINKYLGLEKQEHSLYFLIPVSNIISFTKEIKISLISNPYDCNGNVMNNLLQNFFSIPKYLRKDDIFCINVKKYAPELKYCTADTKLQFLYFKVNNIKNENESYLKNEGFTVYGKTTLIQEANINSYIPKKCYCDISLNKNNLFLISWPPALNGLLQQIQSCINPFLQQDTCLDIKPVFLVEGPNGSGKTRLVKAAAETLGLHLLEADFAEIQSLTSAQTEAKLRIILNEAENCVPCIIMFQNIQIFGMNAEGQKDDRVLSAFANEIKKIYSEKLKYPLVIIATSNDSDISVDTEKTFVEKIVMNHLKQEERYEILSWLIECKGLKHKADLHKIAKICSDFVLADFEALVLHAVKNHFKFLDPSQQNDVIELKNDDFVYACEYMQSIFSNEIGTPRVPKVYWEDIGGLADLKHEIMRRTEMSLLNISGIGRSGLLLYGPPGTGKTLLAKAVATECQIHFLSVKGPELLNMYVGQSEKNVRQVFERARAAAPCIIFFDELDSLAPNRGQSGDSGGVMDRVVSQLLAEMDGLESTNNVFIIGATNRPDLIDPALLRPGRFDKMLYVGIYSDMISQMCVLKALTRRFKMERNGQELDDLVIKLPKNLTGADFYSVCSNAWLRAVRRILTDDQVNKKKIKGENVIVTLDDFIHASKELVPSVSREEMLRYEKLKNDLSSK